MLVEVTQSIIDAARSHSLNRHSLENYCAPTDCAVAKAVQATLMNPTAGWSFSSGYTVDANDNVDKNYSVVDADLRQLLDFIEAFDYNKPVAPFSFTIEPVAPFSFTIEVK